jgi:nucleoid DNA-binding protein
MKPKTYKKLVRVDLSDDDFVDFFSQLIARKRVAIRGVGKFFARKVAERKTYNNLMDKVIVIPQHYVLKFTAFDRTNQLLNEKIK